MTTKDWKIEFDELHCHKAWHETTCPAHTNNMRPESECDCLYSFIGNEIRDFITQLLSSKSQEICYNCGKRPCDNIKDSSQK